MAAWFGPEVSAEAVIHHPGSGPDRGGPGCLGGPAALETTGQCAEVRPIATLLGCPDCHLPAEVTDRFTLDSTDGPVDHVSLACVDGHHFRMPVDGLPPEAQSLAATVSAANSRIGFSRMPGRLGTVANADSGTAIIRR